MKLDRYQLTAKSDFSTFEFFSVGVKGKITKLIQFQKTEIVNVYNLAFGDKDAVSGKINDMVITNNGDKDKVLATVVRAVYLLTEHYPDAWIHAAGSAAARTRMYQRGITRFSMLQMLTLTF